MDATAGPGRKRNGAFRDGENGKLPFAGHGSGRPIPPMGSGRIAPRRDVAAQGYYR
jgi:hypothetical protein